METGGDEVVLINKMGEESCTPEATVLGSMLDIFWINALFENYRTDVPHRDIFLSLVLCSGNLFSSSQPLYASTLFNTKDILLEPNLGKLPQSSCSLCCCILRRFL
jgi:hypothetical protein